MAETQPQPTNRPSDPPRPTKWQLTIERMRKTGFFSFSQIGTPSAEDFLPRVFLMQQARLRALVQDQEETRKAGEIERRMLSLDAKSNCPPVDWHDLYELELAVIRWLPEDQLELELYNLKQRYVDVIGNDPESWLSGPSSIVRKRPQ